MRPRLEAKNEDVDQLLARLGLTTVAPEGKTPVPEATELVEVGPDAFGRDARLAPMAGAAWRRMCLAAAADGVRLLLLSAFRSYAYQAELWERKLRAGQVPEEIRRVLGLPGYSQHHSGRAVDIGGPDCTDLTEAFETTAQFAWLIKHAGAFGFTMSYPRGNDRGVVYEPWHWYHDDTLAPASSNRLFA